MARCVALAQQNETPDSIQPEFRVERVWRITEPKLPGQRHLQRMNSIKVLRANRVSILILAAGVSLAATSVTAQQVQHLTVTRPGGFPGWPVMGDMQCNSNGVVVTWDGPSGYYQLYQTFGVTNKSWQKVGSPSLTRTATITTLSSNAFFKVQGPSSRYAGAQACFECHVNIHTNQTYYRHAGAFTNASFVAQGGQTNSSCLACHTVGYGLPTGFVGKNDLNTNPRLAGVQCESCHGPAAAHAANEMDFTVRPRVDIAGEVCGGCHGGERNPTFEEWKSSGHFAVVEDMSPTSRINSCGRCHSGSARLALLAGQNPTTVTNDANVGITCVVCHDTRQDHVWTNVMTGIVYTNQLRQALSSTNDFFLTTSDNFTNKYNPNINLCAQCHNHRGAAWTTTARAPHHSPQYNILLGTVGVLPEGVTGGPAAHAGTYFLEDNVGRLYLTTNQCVTCHMQPEKYQHSPTGVVTVPGHKFDVSSYNACVDCHGNTNNAAGLVTLVQDLVEEEILEVKGLLDDWALTTSPMALRTNYGVLSWEYSDPGDLSVGTNSPPTAQQSLIPTNIMKARFNLYLAYYDGSYGVHNGPFTFTLLDTARNWVQAELDK